MINKIIETNEEDLLKRKEKFAVTELENKIKELPKALDFYNALNKSRLPRRYAPRNDGGGFGIIAEIKLASPSAGDLADESQVLEIAQEYKEGGADAISIITEKYFFKGDVNFIKQVKEETDLPVLQKDFIVDPYQIYESRAFGADALLLIAKIISPDQLKKFVDLSLELGVEPVVEINDRLDLENALQTKTRIIAINARDLDAFKVDVEKACGLLKSIPEKYLKLGFSGVNSKKEVEMYKSAGARGVLVGTNLMKAENRTEFIMSLRGTK